MRNLIHDIKIEMGTKVQFNFAGDTTPIRAVFIGMEPGNFLVLKLPTGAGLSEQLYDGRKVIIKYVSFGKVYGFETNISGYIFRKGLVLVLLASPENVETLELRSQERIDCYIPSKITISNQDNAGIILDISPGGCKFGISKSGYKSDALPKIDQEAIVHFRFPGSDTEQQIECCIKNIHQTGHNISLGLMYISIKSEVQNALRQYVQDVLQLIQD